MHLTAWHRYVYRVVVGSILILWGGAILLNPAGDMLLAGTLVVFGMVFLVGGITSWWKYGEGPEQDERSRRIGAIGMSYSWSLTLSFMWVIFLLDHYGLIMLAVGTALGASIIVMALSAFAFQVYLSRKGEIE